MNKAVKLMKKIYVFIPLFLTVTVLCIGCRKQEPVIVQNNVDITTDSILNEVSAPVLEEKKTVAETIENYRFLAPEVQEIIRNYPATLPKNSNYRIGYEFQIEGSFTGSGNREIIAFYQRLFLGYSQPASLNFSYCFVFDSLGEEIVNVYQLTVATSLEQKEDEAYSGLTEVLGKPIIWKDRIIGYVGDFNGNGKEELYMYSIFGVGYWPQILEFDGIEFVNLLNLDPDGPKEVVVTDIDPEKKILTLKIQMNIESLEYQLFEKTNSYIWDDVSQQYEIVSSEVKYYRWERTIEQFIEIER